MGRGKNYLVAIALAFALTGAEGRAATVLHIPPAPQGSLGTKGVFTAARQRWLREVVAARGKSSEVAPHVAAALGLTKGDGAKQIATRSPNGDHHVYSPLSDGGLLLSIVNSANARNYHFDAQFRLIAAVTGIDDEPIPIPMPDAKIVGEAELKYWADMADQLQALPDDQR